MKKQKMSLERMKSVLTNTLSRDEMKEVMAGSGGGGCGVCWFPSQGVGYNCYQVNSICTCSANGAYCI